VSLLSTEMKCHAEVVLDQLSTVMSVRRAVVRCHLPSTYVFEMQHYGTLLGSRIWPGNWHLYQCYVNLSDGTASDALWRWVRWNDQ